MNKDKDIQHSLKDDMADQANKDTPQIVNVPQTMSALIVWAVGRFGIGIIGLFACWIFYSDMKLDRERTMAAFENQTKTTMEFRHALETNTKVLERMVSKIDFHSK